MDRFFKYFKIPFIVTAVIAVICIIIRIVNNNPEPEIMRNDQSDLVGNVFDYAGALGASNVAELDAYVAEMEKRVGCDIAVVVLNETLEGKYSSEPSEWVRSYAKDFVLYHNMGYEKGQGESIVFVDNLYREPSTGKVYSYLFTWGDIENHLARSSCEELLDDALENLTDYSDSAAYMYAYSRVIELLPKYISGTGLADVAMAMKPVYIIGVAFLIAIIYILVNWNSSVGKRTTTSTTYVENGKPNITRRQDIFLRKSVTKRKIQQSSSGGGGGHGGGGGGHSR